MGNYKNPREYHGMTKTPEYLAWRHIRAHCFDSNNHAYKNYGARGISMCDEWSRSFVVFYEYVGPRPSSRHSINRIDNDGDYEPGNVEWASKHRQMINQRIRSTNTTGYRGVCLDKRHNKYTARIRDGDYRIAFPLRETSEEAALDYDIASIQLRGDYGTRNIL